MAFYRVYYCDCDGKVFSTNDVEATDDAGSIECARRLVNGPAPIFEVWHRDRLVHRHPRSAQTSGRNPERLGRHPAA
jgi:hypothetical protein